MQALLDVKFRVLVQRSSAYKGIVVTKNLAAKGTSTQRQISRLFLATSTTSECRVFQHVHSSLLVLHQGVGRHHSLGGTILGHLVDEDAAEVEEAGRIGMTGGISIEKGHTKGTEEIIHRGTDRTHHRLDHHILGTDDGRGHHLGGASSLPRVVRVFHRLLGVVIPQDLLVTLLGLLVGGTNVNHHLAAVMVDLHDGTRDMKPHVALNLVQEISHRLGGLLHP
ncbi:hypothetical protein EV421DRAFT_1734702 [Armillaria borealis]|uniref:Uncharacterized protein n=1 Tax=Armillaria borealis TaxID=47425 RepID=A0AA39JMY0_9AGAR|nr:hypothetical protein EV421DRAFT_1734702 [Armillaria borealis]